MHQASVHISWHPIRDHSSKRDQRLGSVTKAVEIFLSTSIIASYWGTRFRGLVLRHLNSKKVLCEVLTHNDALMSMPTCCQIKQNVAELVPLSFNEILRIDSITEE